MQPETFAGLFKAMEDFRSTIDWLDRRCTVSCRDEMT